MSYTDLSSSYSPSNACNCGRDDGDGASCCCNCGQYICDYGCKGMPHLINTDQGLYCSDCLKDTVLIYPEIPEQFDLQRMIKHDWEFCEYGACRNKIIFGSMEHIYLRKRLICRQCLDTIVDEAFANVNDDDDEEEEEQ